MCSVSAPLLILPQGHELTVQVYMHRVETFVNMFLIDARCIIHDCD